MEAKKEHLVNNRVRIKLGSGTTTKVWEEEELKNMLIDVIKHELFDSDFYYNWTKNKSEYVKSFNYYLSNLTTDIQYMLDRWFIFKRTACSPNQDVLVFKDMETRLWIDEWFKSNNSVTQELRNDYYAYRKKYAGVDLNNTNN
jgi:hypothetical protein